MEASLIRAYLTARGFSEELIERVLSQESEKQALAAMILDYEKELFDKGFSRRDALQNFIVYRKNEELKEQARKGAK